VSRKLRFALLLALLPAPLFALLGERRVRRGIPRFSKDKTRRRGTRPTVNDSLSAGTVNEPLPTGGAAGAAAGLLH